MMADKQNPPEVELANHLDSEVLSRRASPKNKNKSLIAIQNEIGQELVRNPRQLVTIISSSEQ